MQANVGGFDRTARILVGIALILFALFSASEYRWWGLVGIVPLLTGLIRWCPLYAPFGIRTCSKS
jgi:hypothetical protein